MIEGESPFLFHGRVLEEKRKDPAIRLLVGEEKKGESHRRKEKGQFSSRRSSSGKKTDSTSQREKKEESLTKAQKGEGFFYFAAHSVEPLKGEARSGPQGR